MGILTTHVLDTASGRPAQGMVIRLYGFSLDGLSKKLLVETVTNEDGRCDAPILSNGAFTIGLYELEFEAGDYFRNAGISLPKPAFLDTIPIRFGMADGHSHYHVPLLVSPYSFSTYRGS
ncbi:MAG: hydroxyisourate hydrolase [Gammaproteobacteria bacterium]|nr:hydroxyisourate hydrolase [Gammaproteobacteria bacterium]